MIMFLAMICEAYFITVGLKDLHRIFRQWRDMVGGTFADDPGRLLRRLK